MSALDMMRKDHRTIFRKIQLLEGASISILGKHISSGEDPTAVEEFLKFFGIGVTQHFKIEETALFPVPRDVFKNEEPLILELLSDHKRIIDKYLSLRDASGSEGGRRERLASLSRDLSAHMGKEERSILPLVERLDEKQLERIDEEARKLGYPI